MTTPDLFSNSTTQGESGDSCRVQNIDDRFADHATKVRRSALWAAYGDALGWISELTDTAGLQRRTQTTELCKPIAWSRKIGGRSGVMVPLPQGCYSDDTQLRLATGRAINADGFDVEAFAKVELPVWLSYALGGGKSTSAAATNLTKLKVKWFSNTFNGWAKSGGNGAAMRIQPHVWAARNPDKSESFLGDIVCNTVCTHSHPTGLLGAVLHALALSHAMVNGSCPSPKDLLEATDVAADIPEIMRNIIEVKDYWRTVFERESGEFSKAWSQAIHECREAIHIASSTSSSESGADQYADIVRRLKLCDPARRGSGILTAVAAVGLIWCESRPEEALKIAANAIGTDTDTIATMGGAILGATSETEPSVEVLDADVLRSESDRLAKIAYGDKPQSHKYPDLLHWFAPKTRSDTLVRRKDGNLCVLGLGPAVALDEPIVSPRGDFQWQWLKLESGQTLLMKRRKNLVTEARKPNTSLLVHQTTKPNAMANSSVNELDFDVRQEKTNPQTSASTPQAIPEKPPKRITSDVIRDSLEYIEKNKSNDSIIGMSLRHFVNNGTRGQTTAFIAALIDLLRDAERPHNSD